MPKKKVLYAVQATGNGHIARAQEIVPLLAKYVEVDVFVSGSQAQLPVEWKNVAYHAGISLFYNDRGGISYGKTLFRNNWLRAVSSILTFDLSAYDLIVNDFEPITAWAARFRNKKCLQMSHQVALLCKEVPQPTGNKKLAQVVLRWFAPSKEAVGFHFLNYAKHIYPPVIRSKIKRLNASKGNHFLVYLPSYSDTAIYEFLEPILAEWRVFSKQCTEPYTKNHVQFFPINDAQYEAELASCKGVLCNAGFETPAEAMHLGKMLLVVPIQGQYEQDYNLAALHQMGAHTCEFLSSQTIREWVEKGKPIWHNFDWDLEGLLRSLVSDR